MRIVGWLLLFTIPGWGQPAPRRVEVDKIFGAFNTHTPGCAVGVAERGQVVLTAGYGMADLERSVPIGPDTIFESGSLAKQFTAATLMLLEQQGKISLDDRLGKYLPELTGAPASVTIRQVIHHISGLREWRPIANFGGRTEEDFVYSNRDLLTMAARQKALNFDPGSHYSYSNTGYNIATILIERALGDGRTFQAFTQEKIFGPLGMSQTRWRDNFRTVVPRRALAYQRTANGEFEQDTPIGNIIGAGGLLTTVGDLLKWNENFVTARVGGAELVAAQQKPAVLSAGNTISYAAGLRVSELDGIREVAHSGATGGYRTWLGRYPEQGVSVAVMCNAAQAVPTVLGRATARLWTKPAKTSTGRAEAARPASGELAAWAGWYRKVRDSSAVQVRLVNGRLMAGSSELTPAGPGRLVQTSIDGDVAYERVEPSAPSAAELPALAGEYASAETASTLAIAVTNGGLTMRIAGGDPLSLTPTYRDAFASKYGSILFRRNARGEVAELSVGDDRVWDLRFQKVK